jgi:hypothetical protein
LSKSANRLARQKGYEDGIYSTEVGKTRIEGCQRAISLAEDEILKLNQRIGAHRLDGSGIGALKHKLGLLRHENLESAGFDEKLEMMGLLDIKVYPSEDLKTLRIRTGLGIGTGEANEEGQNNCGKVLFAPPEGIRTVIED